MAVPGSTLHAFPVRFVDPVAQHGLAGVELRAQAIYVQGRDVTLDGFDLSGLAVMIEDSAAGVIRIADCEARNGVVIRSTVGATAHLVVDRRTLDGGGMKGDPNFPAIKVWRPLTVLHSGVENSPGGIQSGAALVAKFNLLEGFAWSPDTHANAIYVRGTRAPSDRTRIAYNVIYSQSVRNRQGFPVGVGAAIVFFGDGGNFYDSVVSHNVLISALPGGASYLIGFYLGDDASATGGVVADNYFASVNGLNRTGSGALSETQRSGRVSRAFRGARTLSDSPGKDRRSSERRSAARKMPLRQTTARSSLS